MILDLATLPTGRSQVELDSDAAGLGLAVSEWPRPIRAELGVEKNGERVSVRGRLLATAELDCVRCLKRFELSVRPAFEIYAERAGAARRPREEDELERDDYMMFHDGRRLDLGEQARETLLLEIPVAPHCREDCAGLCPRCGADLNEGPCGCVT
ncbi:MAG TPA: DUF177 domain-containing protein [Candidatus Udaeobacter sp.]|jgi:uncharacterized protein|nr:DUF177 domain-containing protein [Candidatus Udaeobacter sp.]